LFIADEMAKTFSGSWKLLRGAEIEAVTDLANRRVSR
jgi:hypothetical protein